MIEIIKSQITDNYFYMIRDGGECALIDPVDANTAIAAVKESGDFLKYVFNTHFHHDHVGGNDRVLQKFPDAKLVAGADSAIIERNTVSGVDLVVENGDCVDLSLLSIQVLDSPGHTPGHVSYLIEHHLFSGDTIFVGGAGNCKFGGDPGTLYRTFSDVLTKLPDATIFYPGHDYALENIEFMKYIEPDRDFEKLIKRVKKRKGLFKHTLGEERKINPFFRIEDEHLKDAIKTRFQNDYINQLVKSESDNEAIFRTLRELRNTWSA